eukprot:SAG11_NODE_1326_length_5196_cov_15.449676_1_plen_189_part_00
MTDHSGLDGLFHHQESDLEEKPGPDSRFVRGRDITVAWMPLVSMCAGHLCRYGRGRKHQRTHARWFSVVGIIPCRGGSKRILRKNLQMVAGRTVRARGSARVCRHRIALTNLLLPPCILFGSCWSTCWKRRAALLCSAKSGLQPTAMKLLLLRCPVARLLPPYHLHFAPTPHRSAHNRTTFLIRTECM